MKTITPVTQIIHFREGIKRTIRHIVLVDENEMTHLVTADSREWYINKNNVLAVEIIKEK